MKAGLPGAIFFLSTIVIPGEFTYPVGIIHQGANTTLLYLHQYSNRMTTLDAYDMHNHVVTPLLPQVFNPKEVTVLPDESGFSFIDNGRLRIKHFNKRWPHSCEFELPVCTIQWVTWIDKIHFLFNAQQQGRFGIYLGTIHDCCIPLYWKADIDCLFPTLLGNSLFFITQDSQQHYSIASASIPSQDAVHEALYSLDQLNRPLIRQCTTIFTSDKCIAFLTMINTECGFFIVYPRTTQGSKAQFKCIILRKINNDWHEKHLFSFSIPLAYLNKNDEDYLVESLMPIMPQYDNNGILFLDANVKNKLCLFRYAIDDASINSIMPQIIGRNKLDIQSDMSYLRPLRVDEDIFCGY